MQKRAIRIFCQFVVLLLLPALAIGAQSEIDKQRSKIAALEKQVAAGERELSSIRKDKAANEQRAQSLARQVLARNRLLAEQNKQAVILTAEISATELTLSELSVAIEQEQAKYAQMVCEAYRSYTSHNMLTYLFSAKDFRDVTRRVANMRAVALLRESRIERIDSMQREVASQREILQSRKESHEKITQDLTQQKSRLQRDVNSARANISAMSAKERKALQARELQQKQLDAAVAVLQKLIKGNKEGASFSGKTSNLNLPVVGGRVKQYRENMAEIVGAKGAKIISIYEGKIVDIKQNRITGKYDVYIAHGEYITSYAGLYSVSVRKDQKVARSEIIGVIGEAVDIITMASEHKIVFGIYSPNPKEKVSASSCFKKR